MVACDFDGSTYRPENRLTPGAPSSSKKRAFLAAVPLLSRSNSRARRRFRSARTLLAGVLKNLTNQTSIINKSRPEKVLGVSRFGLFGEGTF
jgi:hypothetical protein